MNCLVNSLVPSGAPRYGLPFEVMFAHELRANYLRVRITCELPARTNYVRITCAYELQYVRITCAYELRANYLRVRITCELPARTRGRTDEIIFQKNRGFTLVRYVYTWARAVETAAALVRRVHLRSAEVLVQTEVLGPAEVLVSAKVAEHSPVQFMLWHKSSE